MAVFRLLRRVLTQAKQAISVLLRCFPTICGSWVQPAAVTPRKQANPSETTVAEGASQRRAHTVISALLKDFTGAKTARIGWPWSLVSTATTNGTLFSEPRPALPPGGSPPR